LDCGWPATSAEPFEVEFVSGVSIDWPISANRSSRERSAGGAWDNAKKLVEVDLREKNTPLHAATVIGDTVGDPFKDTTSVALNPIIKFSTLFGLLAVEIAVKIRHPVDAAGNHLTGAAKPFDYTGIVGVVMLLVAFYFVWRSFYCMRIPERQPVATGKAH